MEKSQTFFRTVYPNKNHVNTHPVIRFSFTRAVLMQGTRDRGSGYIAVMGLLYLKGSTPKEALGEMKVVYGEDAPSYDAVQDWHGLFKCSRTSVETVPIHGQPLSAIEDAIIQQIETAMLEDRRVTERQLVREL